MTEKVVKASLANFWRRHRTRIFVFIAFTIALLLTSYVGSYVYLSRRGMQEAPTWRLKGFLYISLAEATDDLEMPRHYERARFYAPANAVDQVLTGADGPVRCMLLGLSK